MLSPFLYNFHEGIWLTCDKTRFHVLFGSIGNSKYSYGCFYILIHKTYFLIICFFFHMYSFV